MKSLRNKNILEQFSTKQLLEELEKRNKPLPVIPLPKKEMNWDNIIHEITQGMQHLNNHNCLPKDFENEVYQLALEAVYGMNIWHWYNEIIDE